MIRQLTLQEWFINHQLAHIDKRHFHVDGLLEADLSSLCAARDDMPLTFVLIKALGLTLKHVPEANRQYARGLLGERMLEGRGCHINVPVLLSIEGEEYLSVTTVKDADSKAISAIQQEIRAYRQTQKKDLIVGKYIIGKANTWLNRSRLRLIHAVVNALPHLIDERGVGLASVSSLLNVDHAGTSLVLVGRGPGCVSLTSSHFDNTTKRVRIALAFDHKACSGVTMARAGTTLCRILQRELEPDALLD